MHAERNSENVKFSKGRWSASAFSCNILLRFISFCHLLCTTSIRTYWLTTSHDSHWGKAVLKNQKNLLIRNECQSVVFLTRFKISCSPPLSTLCCCSYHHRSLFISQLLDAALTCHKVIHFDGKVGVFLFFSDFQTRQMRVSTQTHEQRNKTKIK